MYLDCGEFAVKINVSDPRLTYQFFKFVKQMMVRISPEVSKIDFRCHFDKFIDLVYAANLLFYYEYMENVNPNP